MNVGNKIVDGAYSSMIEKLESDNTPSFFFLTYDKYTLGVRNFLYSPLN
jgi:type II restriction enzyme